MAVFDHQSKIAELQDELSVLDVASSFPAAVVSEPKIICKVASGSASPSSSGSSA